jgi:ribosomal protein S18 acetylase RimI-like enzyme
VNSDLRGRGIVKALYSEVIKYAVKRNVKRLEWVVLDWNKNAIDFYESSGAKLLKDWYLVQMDQSRMEKYLKKE